MDVDLKDQIAQVLSPDVARQLAATVGMDDGQGKTFVAAAVPALLATFLSSLDHGDGARALSDAISNSDPNTMERLRRALVAHDFQPLNEGANALTPVLGQGPRDRLANGLADYVGTPIEAALPALGAVEQAVVAVIGQMDPSLWSDGDSLKKFLLSQKASILSAVPASLAGLVGAPAVAPPRPAPVAPPPPTVTPIAPPPPVTPTAAPPPPRPVTPAPPPPRPVTPPRPAPPPPPVAASGGFPMWLIVLIVVLLAAGGYYYWLKSQPKLESTGSLEPALEYSLLPGSRA